MPGHPNNRDGDEPESRAVVVDAFEGECILDAASRNGFLIATRCGGIADCRTCRVEVPPGVSPEAGLSPMEDLEHAALGEVGASTRGRLSCQAEVRGDVTVYVPDPSTMEDE
jgi:ferredoxin